jgi:integrase
VLLACPISKEEMTCSRNDNSPKAPALAEHQATLVDQSPMDWGFLDWKGEYKSDVSLLTQQNRALYEQNRKLVAMNEELQKDMSFLVSREKERELEEARAAERKLKRQKALKRPLRQSISPEEFESIIESSKEYYNDSFTCARSNLALTLLYLTGLRLSNLLVLTRGNTLDLLNRGYTEIPLIKGAKHTTSFSN